MSKLIFLDVDGTLVDYHNRIPESAVKAIRQAREKGHLVYVCTGRSKAEMQPELWEIGLDGMIGGNGAYVEDNGHVVMHQGLSKEDVKKEVQHMVDTFALRRTFIMEQLDQCKNLFYIKPHGAFYIMVDVSKTGLNGQEFADKLLEYGVAVVPANGFGKDFSDFIRISFASSKENIAEAFVRIRKLLNDLNKEAC